MIRLRKTYPIVAQGDYHAYEANHPEVYGFLRQFEGQQLLVLTNFYDKDTRITIPEGFTEANILIDNYSDTVLHQSLELKPYQAIALLKIKTKTQNVVPTSYSRKIDVLCFI